MRTDSNPQLFYSLDHLQVDANRKWRDLAVGRSLDIQFDHYGNGINR